jgi:NRAMP (natural resistance-associated macrophage protein)-like metal ion transporter
MNPKRKNFSVKSFLQKFGPGFVTGASDDDPSGIGTYSQTGAQFGYSQLWTALFSLPFMTVVQEMCGRIGLVTGVGLAGNIRRNYSASVLYVAVTILLIANTINIGADLGAMAAAAQLVLGLRFEGLLFGMTLLTLVLEIIVSYKTYARYLKFLTLSLLAYVVVAFTVKQPWGKIVASTFLPTFSLSKDYAMNIVAILGTTISPYLFFWQADEEVEEEIAENKLPAIGAGKPAVTKEDITNMRIDTLVGMFFSNIIMFFIIMTTASTLHVSGTANIQTANQAAEALRPVAGDFAFLVFAIGIIGTGLLAVPVLAGSAAYAIAESFDWGAGLSLKLRQALGFYGVIAIATIGGAIVNFVGVAPFTMLYYTAILNGIAAPPILVLILLISNNKKIMGDYSNSLSSNILGGLIAVAMGLAAIALLATLGE